MGGSDFLLTPAAHARLQPLPPATCRANSVPWDQGTSDLHPGHPPPPLERVPFNCLGEARPCGPGTLASCLGRGESSVPGGQAREQVSALPVGARRARSPSPGVAESSPLAALAHLHEVMSAPRRAPGGSRRPRPPATSRRPRPRAPPTQGPSRGSLKGAVSIRRLRVGFGTESTVFEGVELENQGIHAGVPGAQGEGAGRAGPGEPQPGQPPAPSGA